MAIEAKAYAAESGHWYTKDGEPAYEQPNKSSGGMRPTTIRDARKLNLYPSVTGVLKGLAKPGLEKWKMDQVMKAALTLPRVEGESLAEFEARCWVDSEAQAKEAREEGTRIHAAVEQFFKDQPFDSAYRPHIEGAVDALEEAFDVQNWSAEKSFAALGFGGKVDLFSRKVVVDYKGKEFTEDDMKKKFSYEENIMQLSAYRKGLQAAGMVDDDAQIANLYISRNQPGLVKLEIHKDDYWDRFECLLRYWQLSKNYQPE